MPRSTARKGDPVEAARALARDLAPDLDSILLTLVTDADTLDLLHPGGPDLATAVAVNRAVAAELAEAGVEIVVQVAQRPAIRRWLQDRPDTPAARLGWVDRGGLIRGAEAHRLLGIAPPETPKPPAFGKAPGPVADRLLRVFAAEEDDGGFEELAGALLAAGREDVLDLALRKLSDTEGEEDAAELQAELLAVAEAASVGPSGWAALVALPVAVQADALPDAVALGESLLGSGAVPDSFEIRFLPGWRDPEAIAALSPAALRRVLLALVAGQEPADLPPGDTDVLKSRGFAVLVGLQIDWDIPAWDAIAAQGGLPEEDAETEDEVATGRFDAWRAATFERLGNCVPLAIVPPSETGAEIAEFLEEAEDHAGGIEEIQDFIAVGRQEAGRDDIVCRATITGDDLELSLYTERGRFLDSITMPGERLPVPVAEMLPLVASLVTLVKEPPGR